MFHDIKLGQEITVQFINCFDDHGLIRIQNVNDKKAFLRVTIGRPKCGEIWEIRMAEDNRYHCKFELTYCVSTVEERVREAIYPLLGVCHDAVRYLAATELQYGANSIEAGWLLTRMACNQLVISVEEFYISEVQKERILKNGVRILTKVAGRDCQFLVEPLRELAAMAKQRKDLKTAESMLTQAIRIARRQHSIEPDPAALADLISSLGSTYFDDLQTERAEPLYEEAIALDPNNIDATPFYKYQLARCLWINRKSERALQLMSGIAEAYIQEKFSGLDV